MTAYAAGLRVSEVVRLKIADIDSDRMLIRVELGKGGRDRYIMLSPQLLIMLRAHWREARPTYWLFPGRPLDASGQAPEPTGYEALTVLIDRGASRARKFSPASRPVSRPTSPSRASERLGRLLSRCENFSRSV
jgi:integrase